jgi:hypothetical protein
MFWAKGDILKNWEQFVIVLANVPMIEPVIFHDWARQDCS